MYKIKSKISENIKAGNDYFKLSFKSGRISKDAKPGQFIEVKVSDGIEQLLRKPFGIHKIIMPDIVEILYEVVGKGTELLSKKRPGEILDVIGPLGNGFDITGSRVPPTPRLRRAGKGQGSRVLVAGGIGVAPLVFLAQKLIDHRPLTIDHRPSTLEQKLIVLIGAKTKNEILCEREFKTLGCDVRIATDDGSRGHKGFVTGALKSLLSTIDHRPSTIYVCGPKPMLKEVANISGKYGISCQVLLEEYMACGVGVCLGCAVKIKELKSYRVIGLTGLRKPVNPQTRKQVNYVYKMVCKDGPVFKADEVVWD